MKAVILAGGELQANASLRSLAAQADLFIAADSGLRHAKDLGLMPHILIGDFDSVTKEDLASFPGLPRQLYPPEKDQLDLELALDYAREQGAEDILILGGLGGRFDQSLATVLIAARLKQEGLSISLHSKPSVYFLAGQEVLKLRLPPKQRFSLLSLAKTSTVSLHNAKYPLKQQLGFGLGLGISNEVLDSPLKISLEDGLLAVIVE